MLGRLIARAAAATAALCLGAAVPAADLRTWKDSSGRFSVEAEFLSEKNGRVRLRASDSLEYEISIDRLSKADRTFIEETLSDNPFKPVRGILAKEIQNSIGMRFKLIRAGEFSMGSPEWEKGRQPNELQRDVAISKSFYLGIYEVTQAEYQAVMEENPSHFSQAGEGADKVAGVPTDRFPVERVSFDDAQEFCRRLSSREEGTIYRLPTEEEWEYACRAGSETAFNTGKSLTREQANISPGIGCTARVGTYRPNAFGLYDMHGNVGEWCQPDSQRQKENGPETTVGAVRGGGGTNEAAVCRSAHREYKSEYSDNSVGFRVVREP